MFVWRVRSGRRRRGECSVAAGRHQGHRATRKSRTTAGESSRNGRACESIEGGLVAWWYGWLFPARLTPVSTWGLAHPIEQPFTYTPAHGFPSLCMLAFHAYAPSLLHHEPCKVLLGVLALMVDDGQPHAAAGRLCQSRLAEACLWFDVTHLTWPTGCRHARRHQNGGARRGRRTEKSRSS